MSCNNPRAKNPRTGEIHDYCSRQCMYEDKLENPEQPGRSLYMLIKEYFFYVKGLTFYNASSPHYMYEKRLTI